MILVTTFKNFWVVCGILLLTYSCNEKSPEMVSDIEGNVYKTVKIGKQIWMAENLRTTRYRNGDPISYVPARVSWTMLTEGAYCNYLNNDTLVKNFGRLYNWYAITDSRNLAPEGWHVATDEDYQKLIDFLGGNSIAGSKLKSQVGWQILQPVSSCGFNVQPAGYRNDYTGNYNLLGGIVLLGTSTSNDTTFWVRQLISTHNGTYRCYTQKRAGVSVRCVKD